MFALLLRGYRPPVALQRELLLLYPGDAVHLRQVLRGQAHRRGRRIDVIETPGIKVGPRPLGQVRHALDTPGDEYGVFWGDPAIGIDWPIKSPVLSEKDSKNPELEKIPANHLPVYTG